MTTTSEEHGPRLVTPSTAWQSAFVEMASECNAAGDQRYALALQDFATYLAQLEAQRGPERLPDGRVPCVELWLEHAGRVVGCGRLRLWLTPELERRGGHVGYDIRPSLRRLGYGTVLLRLLLIEARAHGIERVRVTCDDDNPGSISVIERNGGLLAGQQVSSASGKLFRQYWIG